MKLRLWNMDKFEARRQASFEWHPWYAWRPVCTRYGVLWLETVERKRCDGLWTRYWLYRELAQ